MEIEIEESGLVAPIEETPKHTIWLSNMDLMFPTELYTPTINLFPFNGDPDFFNIQHLKAALAKTLVPYYPLAGHLAANDEGRVELLCTGEGVLFVVARSSSTMDPLLHEFKPSQKMKELLIPHSESRLIMLQVTFFKCGGVCLGIATNHAVMDGLSALGFINTWGDIARGEEPNVVLWLDRTLLRARSPPIVPPEYLEQQSQEAKVELAKTSFTEPPASAMLKLSKDQVNSLKNICGAATGRRVSTFESLAAYAWQCVCKARKLGPEEETRLHLTADARTRLKPPLPAGFFGNATLRTHMSSEVGSILSEPLPSTIQKIRDTVAHVDDEFVRSVIDILETMEDKTDFYLGKNSYGKNDVWVLSWLTLPIYADFGWGKSVFMGRAQVNSYAMFYVLRGPEEGGVTILLTLEKENMEEFIKVFYEGLEVPATVEAKTNGSLRQVEAKTNGSLPNVEATCVKVD